MKKQVTHEVVYCDTCEKPSRENHVCLKCGKDACQACVIEYIAFPTRSHAIRACWCRACDQELRNTQQDALHVEFRYHNAMRKEAEAFRDNWAVREQAVSARIGELWTKRGTP